LDSLLKVQFKCRCITH